jgi:lipopolysaccharide export system permease protein
MKKIDRYILGRLLMTTLFVLLVLIFIYIVIDFSENSDDFTDRGATLAIIWSQYYLNYIPEMIRLVTPVAAFVACLLVTGQMADRLEIVALKAAGISLYRLLLPYLIFGALTAGILSYLDGYVVPVSNSERIAFEEKYLKNKSDKLDRNQIFRQESPNSLVRINYYDSEDKIAYKVQFFHFQADTIHQTDDVMRMEWVDSTQSWKMFRWTHITLEPKGYVETYIPEKDTTWNLRPEDLARTTSDVYQLTYPQVEAYIENIKRSGAGDIDLPKVQYYGRLAYPFSILVVMIIGFAIASVRRAGGKGVYVASGLAVSFLYLAFMKIAEPFGAKGVLDPLWAALSPHLFFAIVAAVLLFTAKK